MLRAYTVIMLETIMVTEATTFIIANAVILFSTRKYIEKGRYHRLQLIPSKANITAIEYRELLNNNIEISLAKRTLIIGSILVTRSIKRIDEKTARLCLHVFSSK